MTRGHLCRVMPLLTRTRSPRGPNVPALAQPADVVIFANHSAFPIICPPSERWRQVERGRILHRTEDRFCTVCLGKIRTSASAFVRFVSGNHCFLPRCGPAGRSYLRPILCRYLAPGRAVQDLENQKTPLAPLRFLTSRDLNDATHLPPQRDTPPSMLQEATTAWESFAKRLGSSRTERNSGWDHAFPRSRPACGVPLLLIIGKEIAEKNGEGPIPKTFSTHQTDRTARSTRIQAG